jgi:hypothetical protein
MDRLVQYLDANFGISKSVLGKVISPNVPLYLIGNYEFYDGIILGRKVIWAEVKHIENITPDQFDKQQEQLKKYFKLPIIFTFDRLESWIRRRLIERRIAFAEAGRQLYIPELLIQLNDISRMRHTYEPPTERLSPPAQCLVLYHLQVQSLENRHFKEISEQLGYSAMTITRAIKELNAFELAVAKGSREKELEFIAGGKDLWERCLPRLSNPTREEWFTHMLPRISDMFYAGESALSHRTMLAEGPVQSFAISKDRFRKELLSGALAPLGKNLEHYRIEVWHYDPAVLAASDEVDILSLYLSMRDLEDERVKGALENLLMKVKWL